MVNRTASSISVIIPVYNGEDFLQECIDSVQDQTLPPDEIIVVSNGSTDRSVEIAHTNSRVTVIELPEPNLSAALNAGIEAAKGSFLTFLDADDLWRREKLETQFRHFQKLSGNHLIFTQIITFIVRNGKKKYLENSVENGLLKATMFAYKKVFEDVGPFNKQYSVGDFIDWYGRAMEQGKQAFVIPEILVERRSHSKNMTKDLDNEKAKPLLQALKAKLNRSRLSG